MKTLVKTMLAVSLALSLGNAHAEVGYFECDVTYAGSHANGKDYVQVSCPDTGTTSWHILAPKLGAKGLAVGMTALALNRPVTVTIDPDVPYSTMYAIYLKRP